ncbi:MAG: helix-turn-helix transcriptional regulator [Candidatus Paceibacterota bacterium]|jgi:transcriptional regulator with XRE-family HTH domain
MPKIKSPSDFLKERRIRLGFEPCEVATLVGVKMDTYRQWECRGEIPEKHLPELAVALQIPETELKAEKVAVMMKALLGIPKQETHGFINRALRINP